MKFLAITGYYKPAYVYGGPVRSQAALYEGLARLGVEVTVVTTNANGNNKLDVPLLQPIDVDGVTVIYCPTKSRPGSAFYSPSQIDEAKRLIQYADIVNLQTFWGYATAPLTDHCIHHQMPYFVSMRGQLMDYAMKQASWIKGLKKHLFLHLIGYKYLNNAAGLHCTSPTEIADLKNYPIKTPTFLVPNSIDVDKFQNLPSRGQLRERYDIPETAFVILMLGRIHQVKNPQIAVTTLVATQDLPQEVHLIIAGPDEQKLSESLRQQAYYLECADKLHFVGLVQDEELLQLFADSDLLIMPSQTESFGMSAVEAMAAGVPILVSEGVPVGEWAEQAGAGRMLSCCSEAFIEATRLLIMDNEKLRAMGLAGRELVANHFDNISVAEQMLIQLEQIVANTR